MDDAWRVCECVSVASPAFPSRCVCRRCMYAESGAGCDGLVAQANPMASGFSSNFQKDASSKKTSPANLVLLFVVSVFLAYNAG